MTKPTLMSRAEKIQSAVAAGYAREVPGLVDALEEHERAIAAIESQPLIAAEKQRRRAEIEAALHPKIEDATARATKAALHELDQEEGRLRALSSAAPDVGRELHASNLATMILNAPAVGVERLFSDAEATGDDVAIRSAGYALLGRLRADAAKDGGKPTSPRQVAYLTFQDRFDRWRAGHPSPRERLQQIERQRSVLASAIEQSAEFATALYRIAAAPSAGPVLRQVPAVDEDDRLKVGPAFDRILAGRNRTGARR